MMIKNPKLQMKILRALSDDHMPKILESSNFNNIIMLCLILNDNTVFTNYNFQINKKPEVGFTHKLEKDVNGCRLG